MKSSVLSLAIPLALQCIGGAQAGVVTSEPRASIRNGTVYGLRDRVWNQDFFLGIPYAQPPVGPLRFRPAQPLTGRNVKIQAKKYGPHCHGLGSDQIGYEQSEDCLSLSIVRPAGTKPNAKLPVAVWIHGGGFQGGGGPDKRYNMTFMVDQSVKIGSPIIGLTLNYRLNVLGFLSGSEVYGTQNLNLGLRDQRLALHWIKENIKGFGGDPAKVTIFGESAGGFAVGAQQIAFGGRDDKLFRGVIQQSGTPIFYNDNYSPFYAQKNFDKLANDVGCADATSPLDCLRTIPIADILGAESGYWWPVTDGQFLAEYGSEALKHGRFVKVPTITGTTSDEGASFGAIGANNDSDIAKWLEYNSAWSPATIQKILDIYPADISIPPKENYTGHDDGTSLNGLFYHRAAAIVGDVMFIASRRLTAERLVEHKVPVWSFRFAALTNGRDHFEMAGHFTEVAFVFHNLNGDGYNGPYDNGNPLGGPKADEYKELAGLMCHNWIRFIAHGDPRVGSGPSEMKWHPYGTERKQALFDIKSGSTSFVEIDDYRKNEIALINEYTLQMHR
ncbi:hypothetical protein TWF730_002435 [Orbilia blumenaviensis]|uniref:Carboxylic ester hydrolase n=1 Tax=Orbilia blumenaviensis TaxID=1796055 RepID=A0AAV9UAN2_9PEZI